MGRGALCLNVNGAALTRNLLTYLLTYLLTREQFKRKLKGGLFECAYGRRRVYRRRLKAHRMNGLIFFLTYLLMSPAG